MSEQQKSHRKEGVNLEGFKINSIIKQDHCTSMNETQTPSFTTITHCLDDANIRFLKQQHLKQFSILQPFPQHPFDILKKLKLKHEVLQHKT